MTTDDDKQKRIECKILPFKIKRRTRDDDELEQRIWLKNSMEEIYEREDFSLFERCLTVSENFSCKLRPKEWYIQRLAGLEEEKVELDKHQDPMSTGYEPRRKLLESQLQKIDRGITRVQEYAAKKLELERAVLESQSQYDRLVQEGIKPGPCLDPGTRWEIIKMAENEYRQRWNDHHKKRDEVSNKESKLRATLSEVNLILGDLKRYLSENLEVKI